jgi:hypothetical protein
MGIAGGVAGPGDDVIVAAPAEDVERPAANAPAPTTVTSARTLGRLRRAFSMGRM